MQELDIDDATPEAVTHHLELLADAGLAKKLTESTAGRTPCGASPGKATTPWNRTRKTRKMTSTWTTEPAAIALESPRQHDVLALLAQADAYLHGLYPPESNHILDPDALEQPSIDFFVARRDGAALDAAPWFRPWTAARKSSACSSPRRRAAASWAAACWNAWSTRPASAASPFAIGNGDLPARSPGPVPGERISGHCAVRRLPAGSAWRIPGKNAEPGLTGTWLHRAAGPRITSDAGGPAGFPCLGQIGRPGGLRYAAWYPAAPWAGVPTAA